MRSCSIFLVLFMLTGAASMGHPAQEEEIRNDFVPYGGPFAKVFFDFHTTIKDGQGHSAFELQRAYLGYNYHFSRELSLTVNTDAGNPKSGDFSYTVYIKNAMIRYQKNGWGIDAGMIGTKNFKVQEDFWGYRFVEKSAQDQYKMSTSADLGISVSRQISNGLEADFTVRNGEGYKSLQLDNNFYYGTGVTIKKDSRVLFRVFYEVAPEKIIRTALSAFAGYSWDKFRIGAEYNYDMNEKFIENQDLSSISTYAAFRVAPKFELFARYDNLTSVTSHPFHLAEQGIDPFTKETAWNIDQDGRQVIGGLQFSPVKGIKMALDYKGWKPADRSQPVTSSVFANFEFSFK